ncbi:MAG: hypothetical protein RL285_871 [Bacteroidota bacterium]
MTKSKGVECPQLIAKKGFAWVDALQILVVFVIVKKSPMWLIFCWSHTLVIFHKFWHFRSQHFLVVRAIEWFVGEGILSGC